MTDRPHIVLIMTDQQRADFTAGAGFPLDTMPFVDGLAAEGTSFGTAYTPMPVCGPARTSTLTGRYPSVTEVRQNSANAHVRRGEDLADVLRGRGYAIHLAGKNHSYLRPDDFDSASSYMHEGGGDPAHRTAEHERFDAWLRGLDHGVSPEPTPFAVECQLPYRIVSDAIRVVEGRDDRPLFLWLSFPEPHNPYQVPEPYFSLFPEADVPDRAAGPQASVAKGGTWRWLRELQEEKRPGLDAQWRRYRANYCGMLRLIDDQVRRFVGALDAHGIHEDTVLVFCSDHGDFAGDYGLQRKGAGLPECLVRVPLSFTGPGIVPGARPDAAASLVDVMPTLCEMVGAEIPFGVQGRSLWPILSGEDWPAAEFRSAYAELGYGGLPYGPDERPPLHFPYDGPTFDELNSVTLSGQLRMVRMGRWKLLFDVTGAGQLYDLEGDPAELHDRWDDPACADARRELTEELLRWVLRTGDDLPRAAYTPKRAPHNWHTQPGS